MKKLIALTSAIIILASCAKDNPNILEGLGDVSFAEWMKRNAPNATEIKNDAGEGVGIYIQYFEKATGIREEIVDSVWLKVNYTGCLLDGTVFLNRSEKLSRQLGKWSNRTHWVEDYMPASVLANDVLPIGVHVGIRQMHKGDSARIYVPAKYGYSYSTTFNSGYKGENVTYSGVPTYLDIKIKEIVLKPVDYEISTVDNFAKNKWSQTVNDTIITGVYMRKTLTDPSARELQDSIYIKLERTSYFLDEFIVSTTSDSIAKLNKIYSSSSLYKPISVKTSVVVSDKQTLMLMKVLKKMRYGEEAEIITTSEYTTEGTAGTSTGTPQINYYTPRLYKIIVQKDTATTRAPSFRQIALLKPNQPKK